MKEGGKTKKKKSCVFTWVKKALPFREHLLVRLVQPVCARACCSGSGGVIQRENECELDGRL